ncbi:MAG: hypothetical protein JSW17_00325 [Candidatus Omnitrophota bacterium]|nr:MAG: hypothetical protein JSW17_00325 [Candidatus Omnitrophota bacterium]
MKGKYLLIVALVAVMTIGLSAALADTHGRGYEGMKKEYHHKEYKPQDLKDKFFFKAMHILKNKEELGLSSRQVDKIKDLKLTTKKDLIRKDAEVEILALDIKAGLYEERVNLKAVNELIDKKYDIKRAKAKALVAAYVELKDVLTKAQKEKLKGLWKEHKRKEEKR